jgi:nucleotide-binding universal stress UspA family protein
VGTIVVGVDGSPGAMAAARFAVDEARIRKATLRLVAAWHVPAMAYGNAFAVGADDLPDAMREAAGRSLEQTLTDLGELDDISVEKHLEAGPAAQVLLSQAADADLLVVGSRGHGGFAGLLLGSVSQQCAQHAPCPVVIVRANAT